MDFEQINDSKAHLFVHTISATRKKKVTNTKKHIFNTSGSVRG